MSGSVFTHMQQAVDIVQDSPHPVNKIAATLFHDDWAVSETNHWPDIIAEKIGTEIKIGNSSGTLHAETACILHAKGPTKGASICITDPFCPNCAKNMAEAGVAAIYIDHKGFDKDFFQRRGGEFDSMSMRICEHAGINVYKLWRKEEKIEPIVEIPADYKPPDDSPVVVSDITEINENTFKLHVKQASEKHQRRKFALCLATDSADKPVCVISRSHIVRGYSMSDPDKALDLLTPEGKYSFVQEPVNRMLMACARKGLTPVNGYFMCSQIPTSREQVNLVGAGIRRITIGDTARARDPHGRRAMKQLSEAKILNYT